MEIQPTISFMAEQGYAEKFQLLITGVGLTSTTYYLTKQVLTKRPDIIVQAGLAGTLDPSIALGEVVVVHEDCIGDEGVMENHKYRTLFDLGLCDSKKPPYQNGKLKSSGHLFLEHYRIVSGVSVNEISTTEQKISYYRHHLKADVETLEGAALHFIGALENIPTIQIRAISNYIGERDKSKWKIHDAITALNRELKTLLPKLITT